LLLDFLKYQDFKTFSKQLKNSNDKSSRASSTKEFYTTSGFHSINASKHILDFGEKFSIYLNVFETFSTKFHNLTRKLAEEYREISKILNELSD